MSAPGGPKGEIQSAQHEGAPLSATIFVLDVEEFRPLVTVARTMPNVTVSGPVQGYLRITAPQRLEFNRKALGFKPAIWYGALTGGMVGRVTEFGRDTLCIEATPE